MARCVQAGTGPRHRPAHECGEARQWIVRGQLPHRVHLLCDDCADELRALGINLEPERRAVPR
jgi:hypothetical protein